MHAWRFLQTAPIETVQELLRREPTNNSRMIGDEDDLRMSMLIHACHMQGADADEFECEGVDLEAEDYKHVRVDLDYNVKAWEAEVETWYACQKYALTAAEIEAYDLLRERLSDMADAGRKLPEDLVEPASVLLKRASCTL